MDREIKLLFRGLNKCWHVGPAAGDSAAGKDTHSLSAESQSDDVINRVLQRMRLSLT